MWEEYEITYSAAKELRDEKLPELPALKKEITAVKAKIKSSVMSMSMPLTITRKFLRDMNS